MTTNNNFSCLPFYKSTDELHSNKEYAYGRAYPLLCPVNYLLPFVILRRNRAERVLSVKMYNTKAEEINDLTEQISNAGLDVKSFDGFDTISYNANLPLGDDMLEGFYYLSVSDGVETWYSELFQLVTDADKLLCLEWWDEEPLFFNGGCIPYQKNRFVNRLYFDTKIGKPTYDFKEEGEERDGFFFPISQLSEKVYKFVIIAPEYLCDAMRTIRMADYIHIKSEGKTYDADQFLCNVEWQEQGDLASVVCEFQTDTIVKKIGKAFLREPIGDYTEDFNNDYNVREG